MHPYWMKKLGGPTGDELQMYEDNRVYRRQDLPPVYMLDGGIIAVTRRSLFTTVPGAPHAFLGRDRRAVVTQPGEVVRYRYRLEFAGGGGAFAIELNTKTRRHKDTKKRRMKPQMNTDEQR